MPDEETMLRHRLTPEETIRLDDGIEAFHEKRRARAEMDPPDAAHAAAHVCGGCGFPLGYRDVVGIDGKAYLPCCAEEVRAKRENQKGAA